MKHLLAICLAAAPVFAQANLLQNGSFEANSQALGSRWSFLSNPAGGWLTPRGAVELHTRSYASPSAQEGSNAIELEGQCNFCQLSQSFATVVGQSYEISFWIAQRFDSLGAASNGLTWQISSSPEAELVGQDNNKRWTQIRRNFLATESQTTLTFAAAGAQDGYGTLLDNVSVVPLSPIPGPPSYGLMGAGLVVILFAAWRRKNKKR